MCFCGDFAFSSFVVLIFPSLFCCYELNVVLFCSDEVDSLQILLFVFKLAPFLWVSQLVHGLPGLLLFVSVSVGDLHDLPGLFSWFQT